MAEEPEAVRAAIGVTGQYSAVDSLLAGRENLAPMARLNHRGRHLSRQRTAELLERFDLVEAAGRPASTYSGGMRRHPSLTLTLLGMPVVFLLLFVYVFGGATGTGAGDSALPALAWCAVIALASYLWAKRLHDRDPVA